MRVVVAGGSGFVGRYIVRALIDDGHEIAVLSRSPEKIADIAQLRGAEGVSGDVTDPDTLRGTLDGADAIVGAVQFPGYPAEVPRKRLTFDEYDHRGTRHLIAEAERAGVGKYVYISGAGADRASDKPWYRAKGKAEAALRASELTWAIVRPSWAYGAEDRALNRFVQIARFSPLVPRIGIRRQLIQPVYVGDIARTVAAVFERPDAWERVYEIGGPEVLGMEDVIHTMLEVVGSKRLVVPVPKWLAKLGVAPLTVLPKPPMTPGGIEFAAQDGVVDTTELTKTLEVHPLALRDGLSLYLP